MKNSDKRDLCCNRTGRGERSNFYDKLKGGTSKQIMSHKTRLSLNFIQFL